MKKKEIIQELKRYGYSRVNIDTDRRTSKTFYTYRGGIHINGTENLSFHIVPPPDGLPYALHGTGKAHSWEQNMLRSFFSACSPF